MSMENYYTLPMEDVNDEDARNTELYFNGGDKVKDGDLIYSFETTKAVVDVEAEHDGYIHFLIEENQRVNVGATTCLITQNPDFELVTDIDEDQDLQIAFTLTKRAESFVEKHQVDLSSLSLKGIVKERDIRALIEIDLQAPVEKILILDRENDLNKRLLEDSSLRDLDSQSKIELLREAGHQIHDSVRIAKGALIIGNEITIGQDVVIGEDTVIEAPIIQIDHGTRIGRNCDFVASKIHLGSLNRIGDSVIVDISGGRYSDSELETGRDCLIAGGAYINVCRAVTLGEHVAISPRSMVFTHSFWQSVLEGYPASFAPVIIEDDAWLGAAAQVLPNVKIETGSIVMSGSIVTNAVSAYTMVGGVPAMVIRDNLMKQLSHKQICQDLDSIFTSLTQQLEAMGYSLMRLSETTFEVKSQAGDVRYLELIYDGERDNADHNDIVLVYRNARKIEAETVLSIEEKKINNTPDTLVSFLLEYLRRRGIRFYPEA